MAGRQEGFTLMELIVAMLIIAILASMGAMYLGDIRKRAGDSQAFTEGRNLMTALNDAYLGDEDVYFGDGSAELSGDVGVWNSDQSVAREAIFTLSDTVMARLNGNTAAGEVEVYIWSIDGTADPGALNSDKKKEYLYYINESTGEVSTPLF